MYRQRAKNEIVDTFSEILPGEQNVTYFGKAQLLNRLVWLSLSTRALSKFLALKDKCGLCTRDSVVVHWQLSLWYESGTHQLLHWPLVVAICYTSAHTWMKTGCVTFVDAPWLRFTVPRQTIEDIYSFVAFQDFSQHGLKHMVWECEQRWGSQWETIVVVMG